MRTKRTEGAMLAWWKILWVLALSLCFHTWAHAQGPIVSLSTTSINFNNQVVGTTSAAKSVQVTNTGSAALIITSITASADFAQTNTCVGTTILPNRKCQISVTYTPSVAGSEAGAITINDNAANSPQMITLSATAVAAVTLSPATLAFSNQAVGTTSASKAISLANNQAVALKISDVAASTEFAQTNNCGSSVPAGTKCAINVTFTPTTLGARAGSLTITDDASTSPQVVALSGTGTANLTLSVSSLSLGNQIVGATGAPKTVTVSNNNPIAIAISSIVTSGDFAQTNTCDGSIGANLSCVISVTFTPAALGSSTGAITITDDATNNPQIVSLSGTGTTPPVTVSPGTLFFGNQIVGSSSAVQTVQVTNTGSGNLTGISIAVSGDFTQANTCPGTLASGAGCNIDVTFRPTAAGMRNGLVTITDSASTSPQQVNLSGTAIALTSIIVTPAGASIPVGATQQFTATGVYSDTSTRNVTSLVDWTSSAPSTSSINGAGLAAGIAPGNTTIQAVQGAVRGSTTLTITAGFVLTGSMITVRSRSIATLLNSGMVLLAGGIGPSPLAAAELYDPGAGTFSATGSMVNSRELHTANLLKNGKVLLTGGIDSSNSVLSAAELYDPAAGAFFATGSMHGVRYWHTGTLLSNGQVLIAGGYDASGTALASAELYDPVTGTFMATGSMSSPRVLHTATLLNNGQVLITGGLASNLGILATAELYDPATGRFTSTISMTGRRLRHTATLLNSGKVLIAGGEDPSILTTAELYDPSTFTFTATGSMNTPRTFRTATLLNSGKVLVGGGATVGMDNIPSYLATAELYDPATGRFTFTESMAQPRYEHTGTLLNSGKVLVAGGSTGQPGTICCTAAAELYLPDSLVPHGLVSIAVAPANPSIPETANQQFIATGSFEDGTIQRLASASWSSSTTAVASISNDTDNRGVALPLASGTTTITASAGAVSGSTILTVRSAGFASTGSMTSPRSDHTATLLKNGRVLLAGGINGSSILATAELYDPATGMFTATGRMGSARYSHTATLLNNGTVLITGGFIGGGASQVATAELYNPSTGAFTATGSMTIPRGEHSATLLNDGKVLITGDRFGSAIAELYDPEAGTFAATGSMTAGRGLHTATLLKNGRVLIAGGFSSAYLATAELYDPVTRTFTPTGSMTTGRIRHTATLMSNGKVLVAGGYDDFWGQGSGDIAELYDPDAGTFTTTGRTITEHAFHTATLLNNGKVLIAGGQVSPGLDVATAELYDPASGKLVATGNMAYTRERHTATLLNNGQVLITGGQSASILASAELY